MIREVLLSEKAERVFQGLSNDLQVRVRRALLEFARTGRGDLKKLTGTKGREDFFRLGVGDYRIVFALSPSEIRVTRIVHRSEGYDWL